MAGLSYVCWDSTKANKHDYIIFNDVVIHSCPDLYVFVYGI